VTLLVAGADGQLGREVVRASSGTRPVVALGRRDMDVTDPGAVQVAVAAHRPTVVVNCAAWTDVDGCEMDPERADLANARAVGHLAGACAEVGAHLVQVSTDFVFDGAPGPDGTLAPYGEDHPTNPLNVYGASKLAGEVAAGAGATVVRTTWLQSADGPGMVGRILADLEADGKVGGAVELLGDRRACPTFIVDLVPALLRLADERVAGVVHVVNEGVASWAEVGRMVATEVGADPDRIVSIAEADLGPPRPARRPAYSALDVAALRRLGHPPLRHHRDAVSATVARLRG
jgi:dTDP-4-dehydrorhamnose reductase